MRTLTFILCVVMLACSPKKVPDPFPPNTETYEIPVTPAQIDNVLPEGATQDSPQEKFADVVIVVPPSTVPTHIVVKKKPTTFLKKELTNTPRNEIKSDNKNVQAYQPKETLWWKWVLVIIAVFFLVAAIAMGIAVKVANFSPVGFFRKLIGK